ncbi:MAG: hypothetical protein SVN78_00620 [Deferribacterota bacterium]|nr:hypothetical protein [Deferribacterota bacterium]
MDKVKNKYLRDIDYFSKKVELEPDSKYYFPLAFAYMNLSKYDSVIDVCEKGLERHPTYMPLATLLGEAFLKKGMFEEARVVLESVKEKDPNNFKALKLLGYIYLEKDDADKAYENFKKAYELAPESEELRTILADFEKKEQVDENALSSENQDKETSGVDNDIDGLLDDIFKNIDNNMEQKESNDGEESKNSSDVEASKLQDSVNDINNLLIKSKNVDEALEGNDKDDFLINDEEIANILNEDSENMEKDEDVDTRDKTLESLNKLLDNIASIKRERGIL